MNKYNEEECEAVMDKINTVSNNVNPYDVYRYCWHENFGADNIDFTSYSNRFDNVYKREARAARSL